MEAKISIFGLGYVGSVTAACLAQKGFGVLGVDSNPTKVAMLESGRSPIVEPGLNELVAECHRVCRLHATTDADAAVEQSDISFLCVGTPSLRSGKLDLGHVGLVCEQIGRAIAHKGRFHLVVVRSTVLPGTATSLIIPTLEKASGRNLGEGFGVCVNPEFMREGTAVRDFLEPSVTIIGAADPAHSAVLRNLYGWVPGRIFETSLGVAEMVKYVCNNWHATKVAFANEVGTLCKQLGVDTQATMEIFCSDTKLNISPAYLKPGFAFGGSCLPKDVRALNYRAKELDVKLPLLGSLLSSNEEHLERAIQMVLSTGKRKISCLGLSFKSGTDDLRESPQVKLIKRLLGEGCQVQIWDANVSLGRLVGSNREYIEQVIPHIGSLLCNDLEQVLKAGEVVIIATYDLQFPLSCLRPDQVVIDLVNVPQVRTVASEGICW